MPITTRLVHLQWLVGDEETTPTDFILQNSFKNNTLLKIAKNKKRPEMAFSHLHPIQLIQKEHRILFFNQGMYLFRLLTQIRKFPK